MPRLAWADWSVPPVLLAASGSCSPPPCSHTADGVPTPSAVASQILAGRLELLWPHIRQTGGEALTGYLVGNAAGDRLCRSLVLLVPVLERADHPARDRLVPPAHRGHRTDLDTGVHRRPADGRVLAGLAVLLHHPGRGPARGCAPADAAAAGPGPRLRWRSLAAATPGPGGLRPAEALLAALEDRRPGGPARRHPRRVPRSGRRRPGRRDDDQRTAARGGPHLGHRAGAGPLPIVAYGLVALVSRLALPWATPTTVDGM